MPPVYRRPRAFLSRVPRSLWSTVATGPSALCPCTPRPHTPGGLIPRVLTPPVASCLPCPHGSPALAPAVPPHSPASPASPAAPGPEPRLPINSSVQRAGLGTSAPGPPRLLPRLTPGSSGGRAGKPSGVAVQGGVAAQGTVPPKEKSAGRLFPQAKRALRRDTEG